MKLTQLMTLKWLIGRETVDEAEAADEAEATDITGIFSCANFVFELYNSFLLYKNPVGTKIIISRAEAQQEHRQQQQHWLWRCSAAAEAALSAEGSNSLLDFWSRKMETDANICATLLIFWSI